MILDVGKLVTMTKIVYSDKFTNGKKISNLIVGKIPYTSKQNILVEIQNLIYQRILTNIIKQLRI